MIYIRSLRPPLIIGILMLASGILNVALTQAPDQSIAVVQAVAPVFPALSVFTLQEGTVVVDVQINAKGAVELVKIGACPKTLQKAVEIASRRWLFAPTEVKANLRTARLSFVFKLVPTETPSEELWPIFRPPYQVEVKARIPKITKDTSHKDKR